MFPTCDISQSESTEGGPSQWREWKHVAFIANTTVPKLPTDAPGFTVINVMSQYNWLRLKQFQVKLRISPTPAARMMTLNLFPLYLCLCRSFSSLCVSLFARRSLRDSVLCLFSIGGPLTQLYSISAGHCAFSSPPRLSCLLITLGYLGFLPFYFSPSTPFLFFSFLR